jgi:pyruvate dehydrogenase E1 component beta subunit
VAELTYREAMREAIRAAMRADERVFLMGEDVGRYGGCFGVSLGLLEEFGPERIRDTPLSESTFVGAGIGAAIGGMRPIVEIMTINFSLLALDQIVNNAATLLHMSGGQFNVPIVIRLTTGAGRQLAAQHSHSLEGWYAHIPGLRIVAPATIVDARGMLATALADPDPVLIAEHGGLYTMVGELDDATAHGTGDSAAAVDIDRAAIRRPGTDVTIVAYGGTLATALAAADGLAPDGVDAEVVDLRSLRPLDSATIIESVRRTHRAVIVDEGWRSGGRSATSTRRWPASVPPRYPCPTRTTWSRRPYPKRIPSSRPYGRWADGRVPDAVTRGGHAIRRPAGVAGAPGRHCPQGRPCRGGGHPKSRGRG